MKNILWSTFAGWVTLFGLSFIIYVFLIPVIAPEMDPAQNELYRDDPLFMYFLLAHLFFAWIFTLIIKNWHPESNASNGFKVGFTVSILFSLGIALEFYGGSFLYESFSSLIIDIVVQVVRFSIMGGVIGWTLQRSKNP